MLDPSHPIVQLIKEDRRYRLEGYAFLFEALRYAQDVLKMGADKPTERCRKKGAEEHEDCERHVSGQELCEAIRRYALEQYGYMAKTVLNNWGIQTTSDFGEMVFNLIRVGQMRKTPADQRADFDDVYDFDTAFRQSFKISRAG